MPLRLHPDVSTADTDDGTVLLHQRTGRYWQLNQTGADVLRRLLDGDDPPAVAAAIAARYRIEPEHAERDVAALVGQLRAAHLTQDTP